MQVKNTGEALAAVTDVLERLAPWPEKISVGPAEDRPDIAWEGSDDYDLPIGRKRKMRHIHGQVQLMLTRWRIMQQMPDLLLIADDGAVITLWGENLGQVRAHAR